MILKLLLASMLLLAGVAPVRAAAPEATSAADVGTEVEILRLREALAREVRTPLPREPARDRNWIELTRAEVEAAAWTIDRPQLLVVVDRNPRVQQLMIIAALPGSGEWK